MTDLLHDYKQAMRRLATTVSIVTAGRGDSSRGMAATAVMSVTTEPPTLIVAVNRNAGVAQFMDREETFCVNLLAERHKPLVGIFSGQKKGLARFETGNWHISDTKPPVLTDAIASMVCRKAGALDVSTHRLYMGEVLEIVNHPEISPLLWVDGSFAAVTRIPA